MAVENVEAVRRWNLAMSAGPEETMAAVAELWDPDADFYPVRKAPDAEPCHGQGEVSQFMARFLDAYSVCEWTIHELIAVGDDRVLGCTNLRTEGRGSGIEFDGDVYQCVWLRHGRFVRWENHLTLRGALHALGLHGETLEAAGLSA